jgi:RimJ/RimL family protein N-acetyltransferase
MQIVESTLPEIETLRDDYLASLPEFQDIYLEFQVPDSACYKLIDNNQDVGYFLITSDNVLLEYYLINSYSSKGAEFLTAILNHPEISEKVIEIYCKSFDSVFLSSCLTNGFEYSVAGWLYRDFLDVNFPLDSDLTPRYATLADLPFLHQQDDEVFEPKELLESAIVANTIVLFEKDTQIVGCGFITQVHPKWNYYDIGVWVSHNFRKRGYATQILTYHKNYCLSNGLKPICGCSTDNLASQRTLEKAGFISKHRLIEFYVSSIAISQN